MILDRWIRLIGPNARLLVLLPLLPLLLTALPDAVHAGFPATEVFLPAVGRAAGNGVQIYSTVWATNLTQAPETFTFHFLKQGQSNATASSPVARSNASPAANLASTSFSDTLAPGETKVYENVVETKLGLTNAIGAARVVSSGEILVAERIFNQPAGVDLGATEGLFFAGVPKSFSISAGQSASIQGINQGGAENFRYNFALVETSGASATVNVQVFDGTGALLGQKAYPLLPYEQILPNVADVVPGIKTINARIKGTVTGGAGSVILAGAQIANTTQDSSGFEMSFRDDLLGGGSSGLTAVVHDSTLIGNGSAATPLGINPSAVVTSVNGLHGAVTLSAGSNVTITPAGQTLTIAASGGGGGGLTLPFSGTVDYPPGAAFIVTNTSIGWGIQGIASSNGIGVIGDSNTGIGVIGRCDTGTGVEGLNSNGYGVMGSSTNGDGVRGVSQHGHGVYGEGDGDDIGAAGVTGISPNRPGVVGTSNASFGVYAESIGVGVNGAALRAEGNGIGIYATNDSSDATIVATNESTGDIYKGFANGGTLVFEVTGAGDVKAHGSFVPGGVDYADRLAAVIGLEPGDVVAIAPDGLLHRSQTANQRNVVGVYSTKPGVEGHDESERHETVPVALAGMIPVKATSENGPIRPGDLLVSSSIPGRAMRAPEAPAPGTVIGKAMSALDEKAGMIRMLVMLR